MPQISVIVPVYNVEPYLHRCVDSILSQTFSDFELILVDDGSSDNSGHICDEYASLDPRIFVIHQKNAGVSAARNAGIERAVVNQSKWISFVDSDDSIFTDFLKDAISAARENNLDIFLSGLNRISRNAEEKSSLIPFTIQNVGRNLSESDCTELLKANYIASSCCKLFKTSFIGEVRFKSGVKFGEDLQFVFSLLYKCPRYLAVPKAYYCYYETEGSLITHLDCKKLQDVIDTYQCLFNFSVHMDFTHSFKSLISKRWISDLQYLQHLILTDNSIKKIDKYHRLSILNQDTLLNQIIKTNDDPYISRYAAHPLALLCYHDYQKMKKQVKVHLR